MATTVFYIEVNVRKITEISKKVWDLFRSLKLVRSNEIQVEFRNISVLPNL